MVGSETEEGSVLGLDRTEVNGEGSFVVILFWLRFVNGGAIGRRWRYGFEDDRSGFRLGPDISPVLVVRGCFDTSYGGIGDLHLKGSICGEEAGYLCDKVDREVEGFEGLSDGEECVGSVGVKVRQSV